MLLIPSAPAPVAGVRADRDVIIRASGDTVSVLPHIKPIAEAVLARGGPARLVRALRTGRDSVLAYHNVLPDGVESGGDPSLHISRSRFAAHLNQVQEACQVVSLARLLDGPPADDGRSRVALTFDDAYRGALDQGLAELEQRGLPATIFVPPGTLGGRVFWWDLVTDRDGEPLRGRARRVALGACRGEEEPVLAWADRCGFGRSDVHPLARSASLPELDAAAARPGVSVGAHGWSHANLTVLTEAEARVELQRSLRWIWRRYGDTAMSVVSYPYGLSSPEVERSARDVGFRGGFLVTGGALPPEIGNPLALPRISAPSGLSPDGLELRLSGILT